MEMQLSSQEITRYDGSGSGSGRSRQGMMRPTSSFGGDRYQHPQGYDDRGQGQRSRGSTDIELRRERSKSLASIPHRPAQAQILHYGKSKPFGQINT
jgi:hypothetical protein